MPTKPGRARRWVKEGKATPFWKRGIFCVRLNVAPSDKEYQPIAAGIDPGSKKEGFTVKSGAHTYLNIQADAVTWVKDAVEVRRNMRRARRFRKTPCRKNKYHRAKSSFPPSTKARWQWKLRLCQWLVKLFPIACFVVEDIKAHTKGGKCWNKSFSPLQVGKQWFYDELRKIAQVETQQGYETKELRDSVSLKKTKQMQFSKGGIRRPYGGTLSHGFKRGCLVKHPKWGLAYVGGFLKDRLSLHAVVTGKRLCQIAKPSDCQFLTFNTWRTRALPLPAKAGSLRA